MDLALHALVIHAFVLGSGKCALSTIQLQMMLLSSY